MLDCPCEASGEDTDTATSFLDDIKLDDMTSSSDDEDEDPRTGFMSASQVKASDISKLDRAVRYLLVPRMIFT